MARDPWNPISTQSLLPESPGDLFGKQLETSLHSPLKTPVVSSQRIHEGSVTLGDFLQFQVATDLIGLAKGIRDVFGLVPCPDKSLHR